MIRLNQPEEELGVRIRRVPRGVVLEVVGEVDLVTEARFHAALEQVVDNRTDALVVDLSAVAFLGSVGLRHLVAVDAVVGFGVLRVVPSQAVRRVIEVAGLARVLIMKPTVEEALGQSL